MFAFPTEICAQKWQNSLAILPLLCQKGRRLSHVSSGSHHSVLLSIGSCSQSY